MKPYPRKLASIRTILITSLLVLMIFPIIIITLVTYYKEKSIFQDLVSRFLLQTVQQTNRSLEANLSEMDRLTWPILYREPLDFLAKPGESSYEIVKATGQFKQEMFQQYFRGRISEVSSIYFVTPEHTLLSTDSAFQTFDKIHTGNYRYITEHLEKDPLSIQWFNEKYAIFSHREGFPSGIHPSVLAARKIVDSNRVELQGYLIIQFNNLFLEDVLQNVQIGKSGSLLLLDQERELLFGEQSPYLKNERIRQALAKLPEKETGTEVIDGKWIVAYTASKKSGWIMAAVVPMQELLEPNRVLLRNLLLIAGLGAIVSIFVSLSLATNLSRPVIRLSQLMMKASYGNLEVRNTNESYREISILERNFNNLMDRIQELLAEVEKEQQEKQEASMRALQMQIHPHFLYNTLDTIYWMSKKYKADQISKLVTSLGKFFRLSLHAGRDRIPLEQEFEHIRSYLEIQSIRYREKVVYEVSIDDLARQVRTVPLLLQPIVENAFEHGITQSPLADRLGHITVEARYLNDKVHIEIRDNGKGMNEQKLEELLLSLRDTGKVDHIGLSNVQQRLLLAFGAMSTLRIESQIGIGTTVSFDIPVEKEEV
ncbi:HAMP domain-containing protein [Paenibacillus sp. LMG 31456]|uniref:histidine kinase n=1 Tax=Paenibacillus foliorum TaxID=2654974 RepID=A0A972H091_9BACL|nr:sensor histidine kinase [Paenibacillus foliorum]NOU97037.1 HAMP domain-containing protein [Paenibacillus foliorum]